MPKNFIKILSLIIFTQIFCCTVFLIPISVDAVDSYKFKVPIGDFKEITFKKKGTTKPIADYIQEIYKYAIGVVAILATVVMMIGGVVWITAGGNQTRVGEAKQYISGSLTGMVLVFCSYMILNTINPDLVKFKPVGIETVSKIIHGCCEKDNKHIGTMTKSECEEKKDGNWGGENSVWNYNAKKCEIDPGGCCLNNEPQGDMFNIPITCTNVSSINSCTKNYDAYKKGEECSEITSCRGCYIGSSLNLKSCGDGKLCYNGACQDCETGAGLCITEPCCEGKCCSILNTCVSGEPTDGYDCD